jgi:membrane protease YdiL (CAAX protease family)
MERLYIFLQSIIVLVSIAVMVRAYLFYVSAKYKKRTKSVAWCKANMLKVIFLISAPYVYIFGPVLEELIFRAPLVVLFSSLTDLVWIWIIISSILSALLHWKGKKVTLTEIFEADMRGETESDDVTLEEKRLFRQKGKKIILEKIFQVIVTFLLGVLSGYFGIKYQSIWLCVGIHAAWNIFMPLVISVIIILAGIVFLAILRVISEVKKIFSKATI